jgi:hypothetical protein
LCARITHSRNTPGSNQRDLAVTVPLSQTFRKSSRDVVVVVVVVAADDDVYVCCSCDF